MIAIAVDDESWALKTLCKAVEAAEEITENHPFSTCSAALEWANQNPFDVAFLDINMRGMGGLVLAQKLRAIYPDCLILFCTGYQEYALEAFQLHADGYLIKPVTAEQIQKELAYFTKKKPSEKLLEIRCFGGFELFTPDGTPLAFKRKKTKELLAILVDRRGLGISAKEICTLLWDDDADMDKKNMQYLWNLMSDLSKTLKTYGAESLVVHTGAEYLLDTKKVQCDYYDYIKGSLTGADIEHYMPTYSWAEETVSYLQNI